MNRLNKILKFLFLSALAFGVGVPVLVFLLLSLPFFHNSVRDAAQNELEKLLQMDVRIESVGIAPFNRVVIRKVAVLEKETGDTVVFLRRLDAGIKISSIFKPGAITVEYAALIGAKFNLSRATPDAPLNAQPMFDALRGDGKPKDSRFSLAVNTVVLRKCAFSYDVLSEPATPGLFNTSHIGLRDIRADISLRRLQLPPGDVYAIVNRLAFNEISGFSLTDLHLTIDASHNNLTITNFGIELGKTAIEFDDIIIKNIEFKTIADNIKSAPIYIKTRSGILNPSTFAPFLPLLHDYDRALPLSVSVKGTLNQSLSATINLGGTNDEIRLSLRAMVNHPLLRDSLSVTLGSFSLNTIPVRIAAMLPPSAIPHQLASLPHVSISAKGEFSPAVGGRAEIDGKLGEGRFNLKSKLHGNIRKDFSISADVNIHNIFLGAIASKELGHASGKLTANASVSNKKLIKGDCRLNDAELEFRNYHYSGIQLVSRFDEGLFNGTLDIADPNLALFLNADGSLNDDTPDVTTRIVLGKFNPYILHLLNNKRFRHYALACEISGAYSGKNPDTAIASLDIRNLEFRSSEPDEDPLKMSSLTLSLDGSAEIPEINLRSDFVDAELRGQYSFRNIAPLVCDIISAPLPALVDGSRATDIRSRRNNFNWKLSVKYNPELTHFLQLPVSVIYPVEASGYLSHDNNSFKVDISAPYLLQKNKIIEGTSLHIGVDSVRHTLALNAVTSMPTANGMNNIALETSAYDNRIDTRLNWHINREQLYKGDISLSALLSRTENREAPIIADITINPSDLVFNDSLWHISKAEVSACKNHIEISGLRVASLHQFIMADGVVSPVPEDSLSLSLLNFNLDYLFETLGLTNVRLGGNATGFFSGSNILTPEPHLATNDLFVKDISFNGTVFGDARIRSGWNNEKKGVMLDAIIHAHPDSLPTRIYGGIFPMADSLDLHFDANDVSTTFLLPYMEAFASSVSGRASGKARIYGNFKYIDLEGDLLAKDFNLGVAILNTSFTVKNDSIHIRPGHIGLDGIRIYDPYGHSGELNGYVGHKFFSDATFNISVTNARDLLCFNVTPEINPVWNGRIFANGNVFLRGEPGTVNIDADLSTATDSRFELTLTDAAEAMEFPFISFRDVTPRDSRAIEKTLAGDTVPEIIKSLRERIRSLNPPQRSSYNVNLQVAITPEAQITLIMNPLTTDRIRARGEGNMRLVYTSDGISTPDGRSDRTDDMKIYGSFAVTKGDYNFTLQDIIVKDFTIKPGSTISFTGNPDAARLDLSAYYTVNANLTDLDDSFAADKDLNRTNVPVHALLNITGDIRQPEIGFDLEFPTLNSDVDRKVRSIVSTEEMMSRQIIYLLALNRFYTPEYMSATTHSNELVSVASSTLSSRIAGVLGSLSENWNIAPNVRSDKGDFSDVEVDLALSSSLLNNRLLFNGNLGYRDNSMNTNRFIGDFDIEYLLNPKGTVRLKAYNRYNDQNFYIKTATTTQGVGVMYKIDFDRLFGKNGIFKIKPKEKADSTATGNKIIIY